MMERLRNTPTHLWRLRYFGGDDWGFAFYTYSNEKYELAVFPDGSFIGTDSFEYTVGDDAGGTATATVTVTVENEVIVPEAPANVSAGDSGTGIAFFAWSASAGADGYEIRRETRQKKRDAWNGTATVGTADADKTSFNDASGAGTFRYQVRAVSSAGSSDWSSWAVVTVTDSSGDGGRGGGNKRSKK